MGLPEIPLSPNHQTVVNRFAAAGRADERIVAAFLGGSYARGAADAYSDLDLYLITTDEAYEGFLARRETFIRRLGEPLFLEDFGTPYACFYILAGGAEGELWIGRESRFKQIHGGPYRTLLDKNGILADVIFPRPEADPAAQTETLRRQITWFWHDLSHFITAMGRGQLWWAYGQLEALRHYCINLARLSHYFNDAEVGEEPYFKIEQALPVAQLSSLRATCCPMKQAAMLRAVHIILRFYREAASVLTKRHGIPYPAELERVMVDRLEKLGDGPGR